MKVCHEIEVFPNIHIIIKGIGFWQVSNFLFGLQRMLLHIDAANFYFACTGQKIARNDFHRGGFASPVGSQEAHDFALTDIKRNIVYCFLLAVQFGQALHFN